MLPIHWAFSIDLSFLQSDDSAEAEVWGVQGAAQPPGAAAEDWLHPGTVTVLSPAQVFAQVRHKLIDVINFAHMVSGDICCKMLCDDVKIFPRDDCRKSLFEEAGKYFDRETGVLEAPLTIRVANQTRPVPFTVHAVVTNSGNYDVVQKIWCLYNVPIYVLE